MTRVVPAGSRVYCPPEYITANKITLFDKKQLHHLVTVMRHRKGGSIFVFDGVAKEYECKIDSTTKDRADLTIIGTRKYILSRAPGVSLACAIPKKAKMDYIIEKATELGVERIIPLKTERTYFELSAQRLEKRIIRWRSIIKEASKQSARIKLPCLSPVSLFNNAIKEAKGYDLAIIPHLGAGNKCLPDGKAGIKDAISNFSRRSGIPLSAGKGKSIIVFIGPEGDFSADEINKAKENGCIPVSLGEFILKVDTAAIAAVSFLRLSFI